MAQKTHSGEGRVEAGTALLIFCPFHEADDRYCYLDSDGSWFCKACGAKGAWRKVESGYEISLLE